MKDQAREIEQLCLVLQEAEEKAKADIINVNREKEAKISQLADEVSYFWILKRGHWVMGRAFRWQRIQVARQQKQNELLQEAMQAATSDTSRELQSRDKRIHKMEKKVSNSSLGPHKWALPL